MKLLIVGMMLVSSVSFAKTLKYTADAAMNGDQVLDVCGYNQEFSLDSDRPLAPDFIKDLFPGAELRIENIQATDGSEIGGLEKPYSGDYREKVYIVKQTSDVYKPGIFYRIQVKTYGSTEGPAGFVVNMSLLNHRYSAELSEISLCNDVYYKLN